MTPDPTSASAPLSAYALLLFNESNLALLHRSGAAAPWQATACGPVGDIADPSAAALAGLRAVAGDCTGVVRVATVAGTALFFALAENCRGGTPAGANFEYSARLTEMVLLSNVAVRARRRIEWDSAAMKVTNVPAANEFITKPYRPGFGV